MKNIEIRKIHEQLALALSANMRSSLAKLGLSKDEHIDQVNLEYITFFHSAADLAFILSLKRFYARLDPIEQMIFIKEYLEKGRHGNFWWLPYFKHDEYRRETLLVGQKAYMAFGDVLNEASA